MQPIYTPLPPPNIVSVYPLNPLPGGWLLWIVIVVLPSVTAKPNLNRPFFGAQQDYNAIEIRLRYGAARLPDAGERKPDSRGGRQPAKPDSRSRHCVSAYFCGKRCGPPLIPHGPTFGEPK
jgi:hypothetical protein